MTLRLVVQHESLVGVITLIRIAVLAMGLLQYCLNLSVIPPDCDSDCDKGKEAQSGNTPYGYCQRDGDVECSESDEECQKQCCGYYEFPAFQDTKRGEKSCPVGKIGSATIENAIQEEAKRIFKSPYFLEKISVKTGLCIPDVRRIFSDRF